MRNKGKNSTKGITLIALVITIIILLILTGTAISISLNEGDIFRKAQDSEELWNEKVAEEEQTVTDVLSILKNINNEIKPVTLGTAELVEKYGEIVTYTGYEETNISEWRLFFADDNNVYILGEPIGAQFSTYISYDGAIQEPGLSLNSSNIDWNYNETVHESLNLTRFLSAPENWEQYCSENAKWAIGGPTVELFKKSYDATHSTSIEIYCSTYGYGTVQLTYDSSKDDKIYCCPSKIYLLASPYEGGMSSYYLACGANVLNEAGRISKWGWIGNVSRMTGARVRPLVCIPKSNFNSNTMTVL